LRVRCLGRFEVHRADEFIAPCHNRNGQIILRYLVAQARHREKGEVLMDVLWPDDSPDVARHKLHCATSALRNSLNGHGSPQKGAGYLVHEDGTYGLSSDATSDVDADQILAAYMAGQRAGGQEAVAHYEAACLLYSGPFLPDDLYADWSHIRREQLSQAYLSMCSALANHFLDTAKLGAAADWALRVLAENRCDESAYRQLMRAYVGLGRRSEAIRQFRRCETMLETDLGVGPMPETRELFASILRGEGVAAPSATIEPG
jgi:DNA-binding SARP family transcriptional activator